MNSDLRILKRVWRFWARLDVTAVLILVVLLLAALGSCFPQLAPSVAADPQRLAQWKAGVRTRYGGLADVLVAGGAFQWFRSPLFLAPLALLAGATLVCTLNRWRGVWRRAFHRCGVCCRLISLATLLTHLAVLLALVGAASSQVGGWREEMTVAPDETVEVGHGSGLALRNDGFTVARYADGSAAGYEAQVTVLGDRGAVNGCVQLNRPLTYGSVGIYLRSYAGTEGQYSITLLTVYDPGYGLAVAAGFLLLLGLAASWWTGGPPDE